MKQVLQLFIVNLCLITIGFSQQAAIHIPFTSNELYKTIDPSGNYSYWDYQVLNNGKELAILSANDNAVFIYDITKQPAVLKQKITTPINAGHFFIDAITNKLYLWEDDRAIIINTLTEEILFNQNFSRPKNDMAFTVQSLTVLKDKMYLLLSDGSTYMVNDDANQLQVITNNYWLFNNGFYGSTVLKNNHEFELTTIRKDGDKKYLINLNSLGYNGYIASAVLKNVTNDFSFVELEWSETPNSYVKKAMLKFDANGAIANKFSLPLIDNQSNTNKQVDVVDNTIYYTIETDSELLLYPLTNNTDAVILPPTLQERECKIIPVENDTQNKSMAAGTNGVTRTQVSVNAYYYKDMDWTATAANLQTSSCGVAAGKYYKTSAWLTVGNNTPVPYKWGGFTDWVDFKNFVAQGRKTGNRLTSSSMVSSNCGFSGSPHNLYYDTDIIGVDCSGFLGRCWEIQTKQSTEDIPGLSYNLGTSTTAAGYAALKVGDVVNYYSSHVRMCIAENSNGTKDLIESANGSSQKVYRSTYLASGLTNYISYRYKNMNDVRLRLSQPIAVCNDPMLVGQPCDITWEVGNFGTTTWSGELQLVAMLANGQDTVLQTINEVITASNISTFTTYSMSSVFFPSGTTYLEVRALNSSTDNYQRPYAVGSGNYVNRLPVFVSSIATGIEQKTNTSFIKVSPNPSSNFIHLEIDSNYNEAYVDIISSNGQTVYSKKYTGDINIQGLAAGLYGIKIAVDGKVMTSKFIKQ